MATAVLVAPVLPDALLEPKPTSEARKRRREILQSRTSDEPVSSSEKKRRVSDGGSSVSSSAVSAAKKKQMKYDPDVPMSKEEATAWRREQRRKRNRQSAAASRQRQRDRITELEQEVQGHQDKYEAILEKIRLLEATKGVTTPFTPQVRSTTPEPQVSTTITPRSSPRQESTSVSEDEDSTLLPSKMISRQATS